MLCPLKFNHVLNFVGRKLSKEDLSVLSNSEVVNRECEKEKCAWWVHKDKQKFANTTGPDWETEEINKCAIKAIAEEK